MKHEQHIHLLKKIQSDIFNRLDKEGNYRRVDEESARSIVRSVIESHIKSTESYYEDE
jgi:(2Fe-2S) ferredoxin